MITREKVAELGFKELPHMTITHSMIYDLGRRRHLSFGSIGTPNEMIFICETQLGNDKEITDIICLHNYDYDGYMTEEKLILLINALK